VITQTLIQTLTVSIGKNISYDMLLMCPFLEELDTMGEIPPRDVWIKHWLCLSLILHYRIALSSCKRFTRWRHFM